MLKALIIDDEENARLSLVTLLKAYCEGVEVVAQCPNVPEGVIAIHKYEPDLVFLDIEMPEYNGFELFAFFKEIQFEVVFVTAYSQYAIRAFEVSALDYLLKPVEIEGLQAAVAKAKQKLNRPNLSQRLSLMQEAYTGQELQKIALPVSDGLLFVEIKNIVLLEADRVYTHVCMTDGSKLLISKPMKVFEQMLDNHSSIFRPHRSYLINLAHMHKYLRGDALILMDNGQTVSLSRERKADFEKRIKEARISL